MVRVWSRKPNACIVVPWLVAAAGLSALAGCTDDPDPAELLARGERLVLGGHFHEAIAPLKQCLLLDPSNPGAHYYLGQAYLNAQYRTAFPPWRLSVALGELDTALAWFHRMGRPKVLERFTPDEFEVSCHLKKAQVYLRQLQFAVSQGFPPRALEGTFQALDTEADAARAVMPDSADVAALDELIAQFEPFRRLAPPPTIAVPEPAT